MRKITVNLLNHQIREMKKIQKEVVETSDEVAFIINISTMFETGITIEGKDGKLTTIYDGLPLRGGERVLMKIAGNSDLNEGLDFSKSSLYWHVKSITNVLVDEQQESITLNIVPR